MCRKHREEKVHGIHFRAASFSKVVGVYMRTHALYTYTYYTINADYLGLVTPERDRFPNYNPRSHYHPRVLTIVQTTLANVNPHSTPRSRRSDAAASNMLHLAISQPRMRRRRCLRAVDTVQPPCRQDSVCKPPAHTNLVLAQGIVTRTVSANTRLM